MTFRLGVNIPKALSAWSNYRTESLFTSVWNPQCTCLQEVDSDPIELILLAMLRSSLSVWCNAWIVLPCGHCFLEAGSHSAAYDVGLIVCLSLTRPLLMYTSQVQ